MRVQQPGTVSKRTPVRPLLFLQSSFRKQTQMTEHSLWRFSRALHRAINERQMDDIEELIDEDVDWAIYGPIDMFPFLGAAPRQGGGDGRHPPGRRQRSGPPLRPRIDHAGRGFRGVDAAVLPHRAGFRTSRSACGSRISRSSGPASSSASASCSIRSTWWNRRWAIPSICRGWRSRSFPGLTRALRHARAKARSASSRQIVPAMTDTFADNVGVARHNFATRESHPCDSGMRAGQ